MRKASNPSWQSIASPVITKSSRWRSSILTSIRGDGVAAQPHVWEKVREKVSTRKMPPPGQPALSEADIATLTRWIDGIVKPSPVTEGPGRVMARRLNRVEYNNTVRDLLGVDGKPANEFPVDDSGYGFDNIADVLTISPMLMEKYMSAANRISQLAVYGETIPAKPTRLVRTFSAGALMMRMMFSGAAVMPHIYPFRFAEHFTAVGRFPPMPSTKFAFGSQTFAPIAFVEDVLRVRN